jgi:hypothetical protein
VLYGLIIDKRPYIVKIFTCYLLVKVRIMYDNYLKNFTDAKNWCCYPIPSLWKGASIAFSR